MYEIYISDLPSKSLTDRPTEGQQKRHKERPSLVLNHVPFLEQLLCCFATIKKFNSDEVAELKPTIKSQSGEFVKKIHFGTNNLR